MRGGVLLNALAAGQAGAVASRQPATAVDIDAAKGSQEAPRTMRQPSTAQPSRALRGVSRILFRLLR